VLLRTSDIGRASAPSPLEELKLAYDREKIERDERRGLEQRATTMLTVTVALTGLWLAGVRSLLDRQHDDHPVRMIVGLAGVPMLYLVATAVMLLLALTVDRPTRRLWPTGEGVGHRAALARRRAEAIGRANRTLVRRVHWATVTFVAGLILVMLYAAVVGILDAAGLVSV
jgi:hypothetical protein